MKPGKPLLILAAAVVTLGAAPPRGGWNGAVVLGADGSHVVGNPQAKVKLAEYISYTCPHCAQFTVEAEGALQIAYVTPGRVSVEIRHMLRDPIDLTAAMLTNCGPKEKFFQNHAAFMRRQANWIAPLGKASPAQRQRWVSGTLAQRNRAIASDFHFYEIMAARGYSRAAIDRCLADAAMAQRIGKQAKDAYALGVRYTPSFTINGKLLDDTFEWSELRPQLDASL